jgi:ABC-2 type transport system permease protein
MVCIYGGLFGIDAINESEANLTKRGARINVAQTHKLKVLLASLLVALIVHFSEVLLTIAYLVFVLGIDFGNKIGYILVLALFGSLAGITFGAMVGAVSNKKESTKIGILMSSTMLWSFLSGMMMVDIKYIIAEKVPIIAAINPVNMITDGLYALYYYNTLDRYNYNIISLIVFSLTMITLIYFMIRRKSYDSI